MNPATPVISARMPVRGRAEHRGDATDSLRGHALRLRGSRRRHALAAPARACADRRAQALSVAAIRRPSSAGPSSARRGCPRIRASHDLIAGCRPEVVVVASPPDSHAELCIEALEAGAHVLCEKPLATSVADADRILRGRPSGPNGARGPPRLSRAADLPGVARAHRQPRRGRARLLPGLAAALARRHGRSRSPGAPPAPTVRCSRAGSTSST